MQSCGRTKQSKSRRCVFEGGAMLMNVPPSFVCREPRSVLACTVWICHRQAGILRQLLGRSGTIRQTHCSK